MRQLLSGLLPGQSARIIAVNGRGAMPVRLMEMGLVPETVISLIKRAPLGDPLELRLRGYHLSLRVEEAHAVEVETA